MKRVVIAITVMALPIATAIAAEPHAKTSNGTVEGTVEPSGIYAYRGIPFAQPPIDDLRWQPPQPLENWTGIRNAKQFGPRCVQASAFGDMVFRSNGMSEDCLYLNVWTPVSSAGGHLPVLVYFYGGGFIAGDGSEPRDDGENMAKKGIVAGGDPRKVTIAGESAGSLSVSAQMEAAAKLPFGRFAAVVRRADAHRRQTRVSLLLHSATARSGERSRERGSGRRALRRNRVPDGHPCDQQGIRLDRR